MVPADALDLVDALVTVDTLRPSAALSSDVDALDHVVGLLLHDGFLCSSTMPSDASDSVNPLESTPAESYPGIEE